jgi:rod shape-determining protein MreB
MFENDMGVDLGTYSTVISMNKKIVFRDSSAVAVDTKTQKPLAFGSAAEKMVGKTPEKITAINPIVRGFVADYDKTRMMLKQYVNQVCRNKVFKPRIMVAVPSGVTAIQERTFHQIMTDVGARKVAIIEAPIAAALGAGLDFSTPHGAVIVDIGKGTTDVAVLTMGGLSSWETLKIAGQDIDEAIVRYVKNEYKLAIGIKTAEEIKEHIGGVEERNITIAKNITGTDIFTGMPTSVEITSKELIPVIKEPVMQIFAGIKGVLEKTDPELLGDIYSDGFVFTGGTAKLFGLAQLAEEKLHTSAKIAKNPEDCIAKGTSIALKNLAILKNCDYKFQTLQELIIDYDKNAKVAELEREID